MKQKLFILFFCIIAIFSLVAGDKINIITKAEAWFNTKELTNEELNNKIVVVEYFKTWGISVENTASYLNLIYDTFKNENFIILGYSSEQPDKVEEYVKNNNIKYPVFCGASPLNDYKVDIPAIFLIKNGEIHSYDPMKKYEFNYIWAMLDNELIKRLQESNTFNTEKFYPERRNLYFEMFKKFFKIGVKVIDLKTVNDVPGDFEISYFEKDFLPKINDANQKNILMNAYKKEESFRKYVLKPDITTEEKNKVYETLKSLSYKPIKINETFYAITLAGMRRIVDPINKNPLGSQSVKEKKFYNMLKKGNENIYDIMDINVDNL